MSATNEWQKMRFGVDLPALFEEIATHTEVRSSQGVLAGLNIIKVSLYRIAVRAIEIGDPLILDQLRLIGCVNDD